MYGGFFNADAQDIKVSGVSLGDIATIVSSRAPLMRVPKRRGQNAVIPGRHGAVVTPNKPYDVNSFVLPLLVRGSQPDGTIPAGSSAGGEFYSRVAALLELFKRGDTVPLERTMLDGSVRRADCEVTDVIDVGRTLGQAPLVGQINIGLTMNDSFWYELNNQTASGNLVSGGAFDTTSTFGAATAPMTPVMTFGAGSTPLVLQGGRPNAFFLYNGSITINRQLVVDCTNWTLSPGIGAPWTPDYGAISYGGSGSYWFQIDPNVSPNYLAVIHNSGSGVTMSVTISAARKFLNA